MKSNTLLVLACLVSSPVFAQSLPDEINYPPYETRLRTLGQQVSDVETQLTQSRAGLAEAQRYIREMSARIVQLEDSIRQSEVRIQENQRTIPELDRQISIARSEQSRIGNDIRRLQAEESNLHNRHQYELRNLRPLEEVVARKQARINEMQRDLAVQQRVERDALNRLVQAQKEIETLDRLIDQERKLQAQLKDDLRNHDANVASLQNGITQLEAQNVQLNGQLAAVNTRVNEINVQLDALRAELTNLRNSGASAQSIQDVERKILAMTRTRDQVAGEARKIESQINANSNGIRNNQAKIAEMQRNRDAIPGKVQASEAKERQLTSDRAQRTPNLARARDEHAQALRRVQQVEANINWAINDIRPDEHNLMRQRQVVENLARQIEGVQREVANLSARHQAIDRDVVQLDRRIRELDAQIPQLQNTIRQSQAEIARGRTDIGRAQNDERAFYQEIANQEARLAQLMADRARAETDMSQRLALYNRYLVESQELGSSQARNALTLGEQEGSRLANTLSKQNGKSVGSELGLAEAKHWGHVRGEIQGYEAGYAEGMASSEDRSRGQLEGDNRGKKDAHIYAQSNFKPVFFEEMVIEEFKKPLLAMMPSLVKGLKNFQELQSLASVSVKETVDPLTAAEIRRSEELKTTLDEAIVNFSREVKAVEAKARRLGDATVAYEAPSKIPFGSANCAQVYKNVAAFKAACENSYKSSFSENFLASSKTAFFNQYSSLFNGEMSDAQLMSREANFPAQYALATRVSKALGLKVGKEENYQQSFALAYRSSYDQELPMAREKAKFDAQAELNQFLASRPLLTLSESKLVAQEIRGGEVIDVAAKVKNVSKVALNGPAVIRITSVENAEVLVREAVLNTAAARSLTDMPLLKVKVLDSARAGQKVLVRGVVELPGDLYRTQRVEKFELSETLAANPAHQLNLNYDGTPSIKGVFRRNIHFLSARIAPSLEDIAAGYKVTINAIGENANQIEIRESSVDTGALRQGQEKEARFSYVFPDSAKNKVITLEVQVHYLGKTIKTQRLELRPH